MLWGITVPSSQRRTIRITQPAVLTAVVVDHLSLPVIVKKMIGHVESWEVARTNLFKKYISHEAIIVKETFKTWNYNTYKLVPIILRTAMTIQLGEKLQSTAHTQLTVMATRRQLRLPRVSERYPQGYAIVMAPVKLTLV
ncbi:hypothetical protein EVAR_40231_1 [Eumeta japonica]|uniref:Uncharacterized protein n=1 Tax=Eumeta variegata TaxID=151549 RepID=A0A4C1XC02_EUMVA|nr:hypothetical protein EVAR_40231_1 [Eumeta japonica]